MDDPTLQELNQYVLLRADSLRLLISQSEIGDIEHLGAVPEPSGMPGLLAVPGQEDVCYVVLSEQFKLLEHCPDGRFVTTALLSDEGVEIQWCWSEARVLMDFTPEWFEVPEVLLLPTSPLRQYALMDDQPVFLCSASELQSLALALALEGAQ